MLRIDFTKRATKFLQNLPAKQAKQIAKKIMELRENPSPKDTKKLINSSYFRVDSGEYRIIYYVEKDFLYIVLIGKRNDGEIYKQLQRIS